MLCCDVFACCAKEQGSRHSDACERRKLEFVIFFRFLDCVFGVVKIVGVTLILGGAREPSEARPGRSGTLQKTEESVKNARCAKFQVGTRHEVFDEKTIVFFTVRAFFCFLSLL